MSRRDKRWIYSKAKALGYESVMKDIKKRIYSAETESEATRVMITARHLMAAERK